MKKFFEEPEIEVVRFNAKDLIIMTSGCTGDETTDETTCGPDACEGDNCAGPADDEE